MQDLAELKKAALDCGFSHVGDLDVDTIDLRQEARDACVTCDWYGKYWSCPPGCDTLEEYAEKLRKYKTGIIVQTTGILEDSFDFESIMALKVKDQESYDKLVTIVRTRYPGCLIMGDVKCKNCKECTYPDNPCRFPDDMIFKMEAFGMIVSDVCAKNNINYYYGRGTLTFIGCVLVK